MRRPLAAAAATVIAAIALSACIGTATGPAPGITDTTATITATASCSGGTPTPCEYYWQWGVDGTGYPNKSQVFGPSTANVKNVALSYNLTGLTPSTQYRYQFCGEGDTIPSFICVGGDSTFETAPGPIGPPPPPPTTTTTVAPTTTTTQPASNLATAPLPGEPILSSGTGAYLFGYNNGPEYGEPASSQLPSVQANIKQAGLTFDRIWGFDGSGNGTASGDGGQGTMAKKVAAAKAEGATCMIQLGSQNDLAWMESIVSAYSGTCPYFEFGNEPDYNNVFGAYTNQWNTDVPQLKALCTATCYFGGPTLSWEGNNSGDPGPQPDDMQYFLAHQTTAPDFITFHEYPCGKATSKANCITRSTGSGSDIKYNWDNALADEKAILGHTLPTGITESNFDPGDGQLYSWSPDDNFMYQWTQTAWDDMATLGVPFANIFTAMDYSGYGSLDMFCDGQGSNSDPACGATGTPKGQFYAMADEDKKYGGTSTIVTPNPLP